VSNAARNLKKDRCYDAEGMINEMMVGDYLEQPLAETLADLFTKRARNLPLCPVALEAFWDSTRVACLPKNNQASEPAKFRPISVMLWVKKLYVYSLREAGNLAGDTTLDEEIQGFRKTRQAAEVVHVARQLAEKRTEWGETLCAAKLDCNKAYDSVEWPAIWTALILGGTLVWAAAAYMREVARSSFTYTLKGCGISRTIRRQRGLLQGCPLSPQSFNHVLQQVLRRCVKTWKKMQC
jgi:hypothetical protein